MKEQQPALVVRSAGAFRLRADRVFIAAGVCVRTNALWFLGLPDSEF